MATKKKAVKQKRKHAWSYPATVFEVKGKLYPECNYCSGSGKTWKLESTSDSPGTSTGTQTNKDCNWCCGTGHYGNPVKIVKVKS